MEVHTLQSCVQNSTHYVARVVCSSCVAAHPKTLQEADMRIQQALLQCLLAPKSMLLYFEAAASCHATS